MENAKAARSFLKAIGITRPIQELAITEIGHAPDEKALKPLVDNILRGIDVGVLSESGCPGIADPGAQLARMAHAAGVRVVPLTRPSSITLALMASGLSRSFRRTQKSNSSTAPFACLLPAAHTILFTN